MNTVYTRIKQCLSTRTGTISFILTALITLGVLIYCWGCEPKTQSLLHDGEQVNRMELQFELEQLTATAQYRMLDLDKQDQLRRLLLQNALVVVQGQPVNPLGLITGIAGIYGLMQAGQNTVKVVKKVNTIRKENNGTA